MNISFKEKDPKVVIKKIEEAMVGRPLASIVSFDLKGSGLRITISKLGQSFLDFDVLSNASGTQFKLKSEKIAFTHRAFKNEVTEKITHLVEKAGGKTLA